MIGTRSATATITKTTAIPSWIAAATRTGCEYERPTAMCSETERESSCSTGRCSVETRMKTADHSTAICPYSSFESSCEAITK